jgi:ribosomal protein L20
MELQRKEYLMTKKEIRNLWIERLRSGTIKQGIGRLAIEDTRCCLGVLCDIAVEQQSYSAPYC